MRCIALLTFALVGFVACAARAQVVISGRVTHPMFAESQDKAMLSTVLAFAAPADPEVEPTGFRTWETEPVGWYRLSGPASRYTLLFTQPAHYMRPFIATNLFTKDGEKLERRDSPRFDYYNFSDKDYDKQKASEYFQLFTARSTSVTHVGFKLASDGVDGAGPGSQTLFVSIHRRPHGDGAKATPDRWPQVGPTMPVVEVDCGGPKNYAYSAGWNSGEVALTPGEVYAVRLRTEAEGGTLKAFWRATEIDEPRCYRIGLDEQGATTRGVVERQLWMSVSGDGDGLVIPLNKRVHRAFGQLTHCVPKWTQTYVAQGKSLASVVCYAAVSGAQPPLARQRVMVRVRRNGPDGEIVGKPRVAIGNGNYTGDASWGVFGTVFPPGEIPLTPGATYAIEMESIENLETLHGFTNIKGEVSNDKPGFNPYRKHARDAYERGTAYMGSERQDYDLDMQIAEYANEGADWELAVLPQSKWERVANGSMQNPATPRGDEAGKKKAAVPIAEWKAFSVTGEVLYQQVADQQEPANRIARIGPRDKAQPKFDGGIVQTIKSRPGETNRIFARVRVSWPNDAEHQCRIGYDPTGQTDDSQAKTIVWTAVTKRHGTWFDYTSEPVRTTGETLSVWLRGTSTASDPWPYTADFDAINVREVDMGMPWGKR